MPAPDGTVRAPAPAPGVTTGPAFAQFPTALRFAIRNQARNRLAVLLLIGFVPLWYLMMMALAGHKPLRFRLFATGQVLTVDGGHLTLISAGLNALTIITGFAVFHAVHTTIGFDRRLVFAGYRQAILVAAKTLATSVIAAAMALYAALVLLAFWQPAPAGWLAVAGGYAVMALTYGALGLLLGVLVRGDLEGFFLIIMGGLMDTFLQNPLGNPLANKPLLAWFPSFGPMQFAVGGAFGHRFLLGHLALGLGWAAAFTALGLVIFQYRTHTRLAAHALAWRRQRPSAQAPGPHAQT
jgi:ABC-2 type transport system permease protein